MSSLIELALAELADRAIYAPIGYQAHDRGHGIVHVMQRGAGILPEHDELAWQNAINELTAPELNAITVALRELDGRLTQELARRRRAG